MTKTQKKTAAAADGKAAFLMPLGAVREVDGALKLLDGKWKMVALFHLFTEPVLRLSELENIVPAADKTTMQRQLRDLERDGLLQRTAPAAEPEAAREYTLTALGKSLRPALSQLREWAVLRRVQI